MNKIKQLSEMLKMIFEKVEMNRLSEGAAKAGQASGVTEAVVSRRE